MKVTATYLKHVLWMDCSLYQTEPSFSPYNRRNYDIIKVMLDKEII